MRIKALSAAACGLLALTLLTGCWNKYELTDWIFVQAVAIDLAKDDKVRLTTYFYRPSGAGQQDGGGDMRKPYASIKTEAATIHEAVRNILMHSGRKAQWSHMRTVIISDSFARKRNLDDILDFFARDHEPRGTVSVQIARGTAGSYLNKEPLIEQTVGQELKHSEEFAYKYAGKSLQSTLLELSIQFRSESGVAVLPYIYSDELNPKLVTVGGLALLKDGQLHKMVSPHAGAEALLMLMNEYRTGIVQFPCLGANGGKREMESYELVRFATKARPVIKGKEISLKIAVQAEGIIGELKCSKLTSPEEEQAVAQAIQAAIEEQLKEGMKLLQRNKLDAIGIANKIYAKNPALWKELKPRWEEVFADMPAEYEVEAAILSTGMNIGKPYGE